MIPQSYRFSHGLCFNHFLQVWLICNQRDQVYQIRNINQADEVSNLFRRRKVIGDMKYLVGSDKQAEGAVGIWTEDNRDVKRVN